MSTESMDDGAQKPQRLAREVIYESAWVNLYADKVKFPGGRIIDRHYLLDFEKAAVTAIVENDERQILMIKAYRYTTNTIEWEIPAGGIDTGESILDCAQREVLEETGYTTDIPELIYTYNPMIGMANKVFHIVKCRALHDSGDFDRNEVHSYKWCSADEIKAMIRKNTIRDGLTLTALLLHFTL